MISLMKRLNCKSFAKLNLCLHVLNRRDDGFHNLQSIFETIDFYDSLIFEKSDTNKVIFNSNRDDLTEEGNLIISAYKILLEKYKFKNGINITLEKNIPLGSGLGGGSSNAAVTLLAINRLYDLNISYDDLINYAKKLGSDVPFFINGGTAYISGRGDIVENIISDKKYYVLVFSDLSISTKEIFHLYDECENLKEENISTLSNSSFNSFEHIVMNRYPELMQTKYWLSSLGKVRMSGTGSTLYIEFDSYESANEAYKEITKRYRSKMVSSLDSYDIFFLITWGVAKR